MKVKIFSILFFIFSSIFIHLDAQQLIKKGGNYNYIILDDGININLVDKNFKIIGQMLNATNVENYIPVQGFIIMKEKNGYLVSYDLSMKELGRTTIPPNFTDNNYNVTDNYVLLKINNNLETFDKNFRKFGSFPLSSQIKHYWATDNYILIEDNTTIATYDKYFQKLNDRLANKYLKNVIISDDYIVTKEVNLTPTGIPENPNKEDDSYYIFDTKFNQMGRKQITSNLEKIFFTNDYILTKEGSHLYSYDKRFNRIGDKYIRSDLKEYIPADGYVITKEGDNIVTYNANLLKMGEWEIQPDVEEIDASKDFILVKAKDYYYTFNTNLKSLAKIEINK
ncbi:MAG: hypothetical protein P8Z35_04805 [Ignavibacteriaceae bacterium]